MRIGPVRVPFVRPPILDQTLEPFDGGMGVLTRDGELVGNVATTLTTFWSPSSPLRARWWVWYTVIWVDGSRENPIEDYPPHFWSVNEMKRGFLELVGTSRDGRYDFAWLSLEDAAAAHDRLGITDEDF